MRCLIVLGHQVPDNMVISPTLFQVITKQTKTPIYKECNKGSIIKILVSFFYPKLEVLRSAYFVCIDLYTYIDTKFKGPVNRKEYALWSWCKFGLWIWYRIMDFIELVLQKLRSEMTCNMLDLASELEVQGAIACPLYPGSNLIQLDHSNWWVIGNTDGSSLVCLACNLRLCIQFWKSSWFQTRYY